MGSFASKVKEVVKGDEPKQDKSKQSKSKQGKPQQNVPKKKPQIVHCIPEGTGSTFRLRQSDSRRRTKPKHQNIHEFDREELFGVEKCTTGVGVYFEIDQDMFFCAHINFSTGGLSDDSDEASVVAAGDIARIIASRLNALSKNQGWNADQVNINSLIMVCPLEKWDAGEATANGVYQFLTNRPDLPNQGTQFLNTQVHGFIVEPHRRHYTKHLLEIDRKWIHVGEVQDIKEHCLLPAGFVMRMLKDMPKNEWRWIHWDGRIRKGN